MSLTPFLVSISITCFSLYINTVAREEMVRIFAAILSFFSFVVGIVLAPWFVQAPLLLIAMFLWRNPLLR
jgi:hypothetical protein